MKIIKLTILTSQLGSLKSWISNFRKTIWTCLARITICIDWARMTQRTNILSKRKTPSTRALFWAPLRYKVGMETSRPKTILAKNQEVWSWTNLLRTSRNQQRDLSNRKCILWESTSHNWMSTTTIRTSMTNPLRIGSKWSNRTRVLAQLSSTGATDLLITMETRPNSNQFQYLGHLGLKLWQTGTRKTTFCLWTKFLSLRKFLWSTLSKIKTTFSKKMILYTSSSN